MDDRYVGGIEVGEGVFLGEVVGINGGESLFLVFFYSFE